MPEVLNGVAAFLYFTIPIWSWHFCFIKQLLVDGFGLILHMDISQELPFFYLNLSQSPSFAVQRIWLTSSLFTIHCIKATIHSKLKSVFFGINRISTSLYLLNIAVTSIHVKRIRLTSSFSKCSTLHQGCC